LFDKFTVTCILDDKADCKSPSAYMVLLFVELHKK
jgi:hypothetical protein